MVPYRIVVARLVGFTCSGDSFRNYVVLVLAKATLSSWVVAFCNSLVFFLRIALVNWVLFVRSKRHKQ